HLGSTDLITDALGTTSPCPGNPSLITGEQESDYYPFGGERVLCDRGIANNYKFTGKERDSETGLDEFGARYYSSFYGRFTIPDWAAAPTAVPYAKFGDPQSLNLYSYVENEPVNRADPDGHENLTPGDWGPAPPPIQPGEWTPMDMVSGHDALNAAEFVPGPIGTTASVIDAASNATQGH